VIFPISNTTYEEANIAIAETCRRYPGKFIGFAKHDAVTEKFRIRSMLLREVRELGLRGYKSHAPQPTPEVLDVIAELKIPYLYHPRQVSDLVEVARAYPGIDFILAHLGSPQSRNPQEHLNGIAAAKRYPNIHIETSYCLETRYIEQAVRELPAEKILFGSDGPDTNNALEIFKIRMLKLPADKETLILGGNILRLLSKYRG
jgi:predicted TIM-barrel fold metal-dependent hydrolase